jgi:hypothetical protein
MKKFIFSSIAFILMLSPAVLLAQFQQDKICFECAGNSVRGYKAAASGYDNTVTGDYSTAFGLDNYLSGNNAFVLGRSSLNSGNYSTVIGSWSKAYGLHSFVVGSFSESNANSGYILGNGCKINADNSVLIGHYLKSDASNTFIIGSGLIGDTLTNNVSNSLAVGFNSNLPSLFIGNSNGHGTTGRIGIGNITAPTAKLHIKADINEDAAIMLQPTGSAYTARILFGDNDHSISAKTGENLVFKTGSGNHFVFANGRVGIGTNAPTQTLDVQGTLRVSGLSSTTTKMIVTTADGTLTIANIPAGDNLGNHIATQNINLNGKYLSGDGTNKGVFVDVAGMTGIGTNTPGQTLDVVGSMRVSSLGSPTQKMIVTTTDGTLATANIPAGDNMGNHTATQNINLNGKYLSGDGDAEGL